MRHAFALVACALLAGCGGANNQAPNQEVQKLTDRVAELEKTVRDLSFRQTISSFSGPQEQALFDPQESSGYSAIKAPAGAVLAVLERVDPYLDGFTLTMRIGNPTTATYTGLKGKVKWGRVFDVRKDDAHNALQEKEFDLKDSLPAGAWTYVKINIAPAKPDEVRRIIFAPTFDSLQLRRPYS